MDLQYFRLPRKVYFWLSTNAVPSFCTFFCKLLMCYAILSFLQAYLWDNNQVVVEWLEKHLSKEDGTKSAIQENIQYLKRENTLKHMRRWTFVTF